MIKLIKNRNHREQPDVRVVKKLLIFELHNSAFAMDILKVQEIKSLQNMQALTPITDAPVHISGMMPFHENVIPVVDLRLFFQLPCAETAEFNAIIIVQVQQKHVGMIVDL